jgi:hypothetical protein
MRTHQFHPWRRMRDLGPSWKLAWRDDLPAEVYGFTDFATQTITMREGMSFEERRCTITHEVEHVLRGPTSTCHVMKEELAVDRRSSRLLLSSMRDIGDAMVWHGGDYEQVSEELWVDLWMLEVRLSALQKREREYLDKRRADIILLAD